MELAGLVEAAADDLGAGVLLEGVRLAAVELPPVNLAGAELTEVLFEGVGADDVDLTGARLREVSFAGVRFTSLRAVRGDWQDSQLSGRLGVVDGHGARWRSVMLTGCKVDLLSLRGAEVEDLLLRDCRVDELDLSGARVNRVRLESTRVGTLEAAELRSDHLDLRGAEIERFVNLASLRGALVTPDQVVSWAPLLADALGLRVVAATV
ncbi:MAG TPA: pentapeptide repeat-containing protein [Janibacter terrae]|nr:pentapeptide repeat-containing protein [Janibacter terrae]